MKKQITIQIPPADFLELSVWFSNHYKILSAGYEGVPYSVYRSEEQKHKINFYSLFPEGNGLNPCVMSAVSSETGDICLAKRPLKAEEITNNFVFWLLLWCHYRFIKPEFTDKEIDKQAAIYFIITQRNAIDVLKGFLHMCDFAGGMDLEKQDRYDALEKLFKKK